MNISVGELETVFVHLPLLEHGVQAIPKGTQPIASEEQSEETQLVV